MTALVRAEWTKLFTTKVWLGLLLGACLLVGGFAALFTATAGDPESPYTEVGTAAFEELVLATATSANVLFLILGVIGMTQEYRHRTATPTFLTAPRRWTVVAAKLIAYAAAAVPLALTVLAVNFLVVLLYAGALGDAPSLNAGNLRVMGTAGMTLVLYAVIGVGLGALLRNQVGAIVGGLVYFLVIEQLIAFIPATESAYKWLPGGATEALTGDTGFFELLDAWQGGLVLVGYGLLAAVLGVLFAVRRDVV